jgi:hypothetical protein
MRNIDPTRKTPLKNRLKRVMERTKEPNHRPMRLNVFMTLFALEIIMLRLVVTDSVYFVPLGIIGKLENLPENSSSGP